MSVAVLLIEYLIAAGLIISAGAACCWLIWNIGKPRRAHAPAPQADADPDLPAYIPRWPEARRVEEAREKVRFQALIDRR